MSDWKRLRSNNEMQHGILIKLLTRGKKGIRRKINVNKVRLE
jgi:hypothetical protein